MSFDALKTEVQSLTVDARRKLLAFMIALEDGNRAGYASKLADKINDKSTSNWMTAEECERKLGLNDNQ